MLVIAASGTMVCASVATELAAEAAAFPLAASELIATAASAAWSALAPVVVVPVADTFSSTLDRALVFVPARVRVPVPIVSELAVPDTVTGALLT